MQDFSTEDGIAFEADLTIKLQEWQRQYLLEFSIFQL